MFWGFLFGLLFFIPVFGLAIGAGMGALMGKLTKTSIDKQFQDQVRGMVQPGTSALFLMLEKVTPDKAVEAMSKYGGTVLKTSLSKDDEKELQEALHGQAGRAVDSGGLIPLRAHSSGAPTPPKRRSRSACADRRKRRTAVRTRNQPALRWTVARRRRLGPGADGGSACAGG